MLGKAKSQIFIMRPDGSNQSKITLGEGQYFNPVFSPNGDYIAFTKILKGNFYIGIMKKDGSGEKILAGGYMIESPCWCPNSKLIAFSSTNRSNNSSIYMVDISGKFHKKISIQNNIEKGYFGAIDPIWVNF
jgi:TolB protein